MISRAECKEWASKDLLAYIQFCDDKYKVARVHQHVAKVLHRVERGQCKRLILNMPPQHGKSRLCTVELPTWLLGKNPRTNIICASYGQSLANRNSSEARDRMVTGEYSYLFDTKLHAQLQAVNEWRTEERGGYRAAGITGPVTGHRADGLIIDDPFKDHAEAHSASQRENVWNWFLSTAYTRLSEKGFIIIIMTRWHVDDLVGRLIDKDRQEELQNAGVESEKWEHINLPALAEEEDPLGRSEGDALCPELYGLERLKAIRITLGTYLWTALYGGSPVRKGGNYVNIEDFQIAKPGNVPEGLRWMRYWDLATEEKETADYTASVKGAIDDDGNLYLADMVNKKLEWPKSKQLIKDLAESEMIVVGIEAVAGFKVAYQEVKGVVSDNVVVTEQGVDKDKLTRALPWIALTEAKKVFLVQGEWIAAFGIQAEAFPSAPNDDMIDAVSGVYSMLTGGREILVA